MVGRDFRCHVDRHRRSILRENCPVRERRLIGALLVGVLLCATSARGAAFFDPAFRFRTIRTPHFVIYFHQGEERLAGRLAVIAEETWRTLEQTFGAPPPP